MKTRASIEGKTLVFERDGFKKRILVSRIRRIDPHPKYQSWLIVKKNNGGWFTIKEVEEFGNVAHLVTSHPEFEPKPLTKGEIIKNIAIALAVILLFVLILAAMYRFA